MTNITRMLHTKSVIAKCKKDLAEIYKYALDSVKPERLISNSIKVEEQGLTLLDAEQSNSVTYDLSNTRIHVIGGGKCVLGMAIALSDLMAGTNLQSKFSHGAISIPYELFQTVDESIKRKLSSVGIECLSGSENNLPCEDAVRATDNILNKVMNATAEDRCQGQKSMFLVLISGGGSACLTSPRNLTLQGKLELIQNLVQSGADIKELNRTRRQYSDVKGGRLAQHILNCNPDSKIITLILSDVIGDPVEFIASGPTFLGSEESSSVKVENAKTDLKSPLFAPVATVEAYKRDETAIVHKIVGSNRIALKHAKECAIGLGYEVVEIPNQLDGTTSDALSRLITFDSVQNKGYPKKLIIAGGETVVNKMVDETWGLGGRLQELCLDYMISGLQNNNNISDGHIDLLLAGSTDGQDGPTDVAACLASLTEYKILKEDGSCVFNLSDCLQAKRTHDSNNFWLSHKPDWLVRTGLTGTNVMDLYFYLRHQS